MGNYIWLYGEAYLPMEYIIYGINEIHLGFFLPGSVSNAMEEIPLIKGTHSCNSMAACKDVPKFIKSSKIWV